MNRIDMRVNAQRARRNEGFFDGGGTITVKGKLPRKLFPVSFWASFNKFGAFDSAREGPLFLSFSFPLLPSVLAVPKRILVFRGECS